MTYKKYRRRIRGIQILCKRIFNKELSIDDCIRLMDTEEGQQFIAWLESLPPTHRVTKTITIPFG